MEQVNLNNTTTETKTVASASALESKTIDSEAQNVHLNQSEFLDEEDFFDFINRFQSKRMDDQRCSLTAPLTKGTVGPRATRLRATRIS